MAHRPGTLFRRDALVQDINLCAAPSEPSQGGRIAAPQQIGHRLVVFASVLGLRPAPTADRPAAARQTATSN
ncbi:MAG: hypothetical protein ACJAVS_000614 [Paracoccaceae bacterium]